MATTTLAPDLYARKSPSSATTRSGATQKAGQRPAHMRRARPSPTQHLTREEYVRMLTCLDEAGGVATLDEIARALPRVLQPISAVFDLCDAGILNVDWESAFDADMHVWRIDR